MASGLPRPTPRASTNVSTRLKRSETPPLPVASGMNGRQPTLLSANRATATRLSLPPNPKPNQISAQTHAVNSVLNPAQGAHAEWDELEQITNEICELYSTAYPSIYASAIKTAQLQDGLTDNEERAIPEKLASATTRLKAAALTVQDALVALQSCNQALLKENERLSVDDAETAFLRRQLAIYQAAAAPLCIQDTPECTRIEHVRYDGLVQSTRADETLIVAYTERENTRQEKAAMLEQAAVNNTAMAVGLRATKDKAKRFEVANSAKKTSQEIQFEIVDAIKTMEKTVQKLKAAHLGNLVSSTFGSLFRSNSARAFSPISPRSASSGGSRFPKLRRRHGERHLGTHVLEPEMARATFQIGGSSDECESPASGGGAATSGVNVWSMEKMQG
ncbi:hypothetical protein BC830DRAFT_253810 [Chytriomyces sp. MP71]|nr:hypothetical protein BC830DRAFT_253810 [Chytriomyces sp. MP71]